MGYLIKYYSCNLHASILDHQMIWMLLLATMSVGTNPKTSLYESDWFRPTNFLFPSDMIVYSFAEIPRLALHCVALRWILIQGRQAGRFLLRKQELVQTWFPIPGRFSGDAILSFAAPLLLLINLKLCSSLPLRTNRQAQMRPQALSRLVVWCTNTCGLIYLFWLIVLLEKSMKSSKLCIFFQAVGTQENLVLTCRKDYQPPQRNIW